VDALYIMTKSMMASLRHWHPENADVDEFKSENLHSFSSGGLTLGVRIEEVKCVGSRTRAVRGLVERQWDVVIN
jgi:hypothetical protein